MVDLVLGLTDPVRGGDCPAAFIALGAEQSVRKKTAHVMIE